MFSIDKQRLESLSHKKHGVAGGLKVWLLFHLSSVVIPPRSPTPSHASPLQLTPYFSLQALVYNNPPSRRLTALPRSESQTGSVFISLA